MKAREKHRLLLKRIEDLAKIYFAEYVLTCFSTSPCIPLMWLHYSEKH